MRAGTIDDIVRAFVPADSVEEQWDMAGLEKVLRERMAARGAAAADGQKSEADHRRGHRRAGAAGRRATRTQARSTRVGPEPFTPFERMIMLQTLDQHWREHLAALDHLRQGIHLRGYAQKNPKQEYKREAFELFSQMLDVVKIDVTKRAA